MPVVILPHLSLGLWHRQLAVDNITFLPIKKLGSDIFNNSATLWSMVFYVSSPLNHFWSLISLYISRLDFLHILSLALKSFVHQCSSVEMYAENFAWRCYPAETLQIFMIVQGVSAVPLQKMKVVKNSCETRTDTHNFWQSRYSPSTCRGRSSLTSRTRLRWVRKRRPPLTKENED